MPISAPSAKLLAAVPQLSAEILTEVLGQFGCPELTAPFVAPAFAYPPLLSYALAVMKQESRFQPSTSNLGPGDKERGGSYGLFQLSLKTAQGLDPEATPEKLHDAAYNIQLAAALTSTNLQRLMATGQGSRTPTIAADLASMHNSGRTLDQARRAGIASTVRQYVPRVVQFCSEYERQLGTGPAAWSKQ